MAYQSLAVSSSDSDLSRSFVKIVKCHRSPRFWKTRKPLGIAGGKGRQDRKKYICTIVEHFPTCFFPPQPQMLSNVCSLILPRKISKRVDLTSCNLLTQSRLISVSSAAGETHAHSYDSCSMIHPCFRALTAMNRARAISQGCDGSCRWWLTHGCHRWPCGLSQRDTGD